ncbi:MAG: hypothetical protein GY810_11345 [Aureispira sp.]|nr:hypothetical protein [Aureispira sp.]
MQNRFLLTILSFLIFTNASFGQDDSNSSRSSYNKIYFGIEQDVLPYILSGFIVTGWAGIKKTRIRASYAHANSPKFFRKKNIDFEQTRATGLNVEFFFKSEFEGFWVGPGLGYWWNRVKNDAEVQVRDFSSVVLSVGGGYNWFIWKGLYISPWVAGHFRLTGNKGFEMGGELYKPMLITPEVSLKIGWCFGREDKKKVPKKH